MSNQEQSSINQQQQNLNLSVKQYHKHNLNNKDNICLLC